MVQFFNVLELCFIDFKLFSDLILKTSHDESKTRHRKNLFSNPFDGFWEQFLSYIIVSAYFAAFLFEQK